MHFSEFFFHHGATAPIGPGRPHCWGFTITLWYSTLCRNTLDECLARRRDTCLTTHNTHKRQTPMPPVGFDPAILPSERRQIYALDHTGTGNSSENYDEIRRKRNGVGRTLSRHVKTRNTKVRTIGQPSESNFCPKSGWEWNTETYRKELGEDDVRWIYFASDEDLLFWTPTVFGKRRGGCDLMGDSSVLAEYRPAWHGYVTWCLWTGFGWTRWYNM